jgi:hypothetical protein
MPASYRFFLGYSRCNYPFAERLKADLAWGARNWRRAGESYERLLGAKWKAEAPLDDAEQQDSLRAALAYALAGEDLARDRLRAKLLPKMGKTANGAAFDRVTRPGPGDPEALRLSAQAIRADTRAGFLEAFRARYPEVAGLPRSMDADRPQAAMPPPA